MPTLSESIGKLDTKLFSPVEARHAPAMYGPSGEPSYPTYARFTVTSLPLSAVYQPDVLRQFYRGGVPQSRLFPR